MNAKNAATPDAQRTAPEAYAARANDIARLIDVLEMHLQVHAEGAKADPTDWGRAGDLGKVRSDLIDLVGFMANMDRATVEEFLDNAE
ncbi:MAG: hypothetical protein JNM80_02375 [Phycisphaerae bacterium]|nr:hypothetical protein [Phycisphaerae bacterium]